MKVFLNKNKPIYGICAGMQIFAYNVGYEEEETSRIKLDTG